jgi:CheY-like chemotaxis protein
MMREPFSQVVRIAETTMSDTMGDDRPLLNLTHADQTGVAPPIPDSSRLRGGDHFVQFYENEFFLLDSITEFISDGLHAGDACVVIGTEPHRDWLATKLLGHGFDVVNDGLGDRYFAFDAQETLSRFFVDGVIYPELFRKLVGDVLTRAAGKSSRHVRAFGEMVALLARTGNFKAATQLEQLWNELQKKHEFGLFCAYSLSAFNGDNSKALIDVCREHSHVIPAESYNGLTSDEDRLRTIVVLQQKANELESEIAERQKAEQELRAAKDDLRKLRHLAELHGGAVAAHSEGEERGATFTITLPNSVPQSWEPDTGSETKSARWNQPSETEIPPASIAGQQILLVDDDGNRAKFLAAALEERGAIVRIATSAKEAIEVLDRFQADVIVSDLAMPEDDGYSLIQTIRACENGERKLAQAIALNALVRLEDRAQALSAGYHMFLPKPVQPNELIRAIGNLIEQA